MGRRKSSKRNKPSLQKGRESEGSIPPSVSPPLHREDAALWSEVTKSLTPLKNDHDRLHFGPLLDEKPAVSRAWSGEAHRVSEPMSGAHKAIVRLPPIAHAQSHMPANFTAPTPEIGGVSRREMRRINSGHQPIEARLDLHGLYQRQAHQALRNFLASAQSRDLRHVLVITGKGRTTPREDELFATDHDSSEHGVLRRVVPLWLAEPDLRLMVASYSEAPQRHGGEGALYVRLRRKR